MKARAPSAEKRRAVPKPIPALPPVMTAILSSTFLFISVFCFLYGFVLFVVISTAFGGRTTQRSIHLQWSLRLMSVLQILLYRYRTSAM
jgi:hypothetical protein